MKPKYLVIIIAVLAALWSVFWFVAAGRFEDALDTREGRLSERSMALTYSKRTVGGFPFRLVATYDGFQATGTGSGFGWGLKGQSAHLIALPWNSRHVILDIPGAGVVLSADWQDASGAVQEYTTLADVALLRMSVSAIERNLQRISVQLSAVEGDSTFFGIGPFSAKDMQFHLRWPNSGEVNKADLEAPIQLEPALRVKDFTFKGRMMGALGPTLNSFVMQSAIRGESVPDRSATGLSEWRLSGGTLDVPLFEMDWGPMHVAGEGTVAVDEQLRPIGAFSLNTRGLDAALATLEADTRISSDASELLRVTLNLLGAGQGDESIPVPITIQDGIIAIGPVGIVQTGSLQVRP